MAVDDTEAPTVAAPDDTEQPKPRPSPSPSLSPPPPSPPPTNNGAAGGKASTPSSPLSDPPQSPRTMSPAPAKSTEDRAAVVLELNAELIKACGTMIERGAPTTEVEPWTQRLSQNLTWLATYADNKPRSENPLVQPPLPVFTHPTPAPNPTIESLYTRLSVLFKRDIDRAVRKARRAAEDSLRDSLPPPGSATRGSPSLKREREASPPAETKRLDTGAGKTFSIGSGGSAAPSPARAQTPSMPVGSPAAAGGPGVMSPPAATGVGGAMSPPASASVGAGTGAMSPPAGVGPGASPVAVIGRGMSPVAGMNARGISPVANMAGGVAGAGTGMGMGAGMNQAGTMGGMGQGGMTGGMGGMNQSGVMGQQGAGGMTGMGGMGQQGGMGGMNMNMMGVP
ncbi:hypothetical protein FRC08_017279, partial [Ceratobasidium sp. 394]